MWQRKRARWYLPILGDHSEALVLWRGIQGSGFELPAAVPRVVSSHISASFPTFHSIQASVEREETREREKERAEQSSLRVCDSVRKAVDIVLDSELMPCPAGSGPNAFCCGRLYRRSSYQIFSAFCYRGISFLRRVVDCCQSTTPVVRP